MTAKLFMNGRSQAVRLPKEFRFEGKEVSIRKDGDSVVLEPIEKRDWPEGFFEAIQIDDETFKAPDDSIPAAAVPLDSK
ncbi:MAG: antitoxin VapB [Verrucomicrobiales bacterium]|jgi:antitoxin VapB